MTHLIQSSTNSIIRAFTLPLQYNSGPSTHWSDVRDAGVSAASRLSVWFGKAFRTCGREAEFQAKRPFQAELLVSPRTHFQNLVGKFSPLHFGPVQIVVDYCSLESPEELEEWERAKIVTLCKEMPKTEAYQAVVTAADVAGLGAPVAAGIIAATGGTDASVITGLAAMIFWDCTICNNRRKFLLGLPDWGVSVAIASLINNGAWENAVATVGGTALIRGLSAALIDTLATGILCQSDLRPHALESGMGAALVGGGTAVTMAVAPIRGVLKVVTLTSLALPVISLMMVWPLNTALTAGYTRWPTYEELNEKPRFSAAFGSAIRVVQISSAANCAMELVTGSPFSPAGFIAANILFGAGQAAYRYM